MQYTSEHSVRLLATLEPGEKLRNTPQNTLSLLSASIMLATSAAIIPLAAEASAAPFSEVIAGDLVATSDYYELLAPDVAIATTGEALVIWNQEVFGSSSMNPTIIAGRIRAADGSWGNAFEIHRFPAVNNYGLGRVVIFNTTLNKFAVAFTQNTGVAFVTHVELDGTVDTVKQLSQKLTTAADRSVIIQDDFTQDDLKVLSLDIKIGWNDTAKKYLVLTVNNRNVKIPGEQNLAKYPAAFYLNDDFTSADGVDAFFIPVDLAPSFDQRLTVGLIEGIDLSLDPGSGTWAISYNSLAISGAVSTFQSTKSVSLVSFDSNAVATLSSHRVASNATNPPAIQVFDGPPNVVWVESANAFFVTWNARYADSADPIIGVEGATDQMQVYAQAVNLAGQPVGPVRMLSNLPASFIESATTRALEVVHRVSLATNQLGSEIYLAAHGRFRAADGTTMWRSMYWSYDAVTSAASGASALYSIPADENRLGASSRPVIAVMNDQIAVVYQNWPADSFNTPAEVRVHFIGGASVDSTDSPSRATFDGPVVRLHDTTNRPPGSSVRITGERLNQITGLEIAGLPVKFEKLANGDLSLEIPLGLAAGSYDLVALGDFGRLTIQGVIAVSAPLQPNANGSAWTKAQPDNRTAKVYFRNPVSAGKVQFFLNGREIAWVRATSPANPKLRIQPDGPMAQTPYLVRTVKLEANTKNIIEIHVNGERLRRVAYTR